MWEFTAPAFLPAQSLPPPNSFSSSQSRLPRAPLLLVLNASPSRSPRNWAQPHERWLQSSLARGPCSQLPPDVPTQTRGLKAGHRPGPGLGGLYRPQPDTEEEGQE